MEKKNFLYILIFFAWGGIMAQTESDALEIRRIYDYTLTEGDCYNWLSHLTTRIGGRLAGSVEAAAAVEYTKQLMDSLGFDTVYLQPCLVPRWVRGETEQVRIVNSVRMGTVDLGGLALGNSVGTGPAGLVAEVIEVRSLDELERLGEAQISGKIVFFNRPMDPTLLNTFAAYGGAVDQRGFGPTRAARYGAVGAVVRSMTTNLDDVPHTGATIYEAEAPPIPAVAISTIDANLLSRLLKTEVVQLFMRTTSENLDPVRSYNVVGEVKGSEHPEEIILVGGHLDSWDVGEGAHDDGSGCVQSIQVWQSLRAINYRPKRTFRCVMFMNEENGLVGGRTYREISDARGEYHMAAIESDRGGFTPRGFSCDADPDVFNGKFRQVNEWLPLLEPYGLTLSKGGAGADINGLKAQKGLLFGFVPDSQRYFDYHHTPIDVFSAVNQRELELGAAAMTTMVYLLDKYGLK